MSRKHEKEVKRVFRHQRIRKKLFGTSDKPRICVHRSLKNMHAQLIDDVSNKVLLSLATNSKQLKDLVKYGGNVKAATALGENFAKEAQKKGIKNVCFDRGGYLYHGRVKAFAEAARKAGMEF
ncbi:MAG: 50S ribosomal protein L18 [Candidatus Omnitrophica bacterium]|nr:50S ribosomal protein L18 [Candidatus Omnitrophota bacterium]